MTDVVGRLWGFCDTLRHDGIDYGDYVEQITYLLFLKMVEEKGIVLPNNCSWQELKDKAGIELKEHYEDILRQLGKEDGILGEIFAGAISRFNNPVSLKKLIGLIDETEWTALDIDVKASAYEGLLEKAAAEGKKGAGQYFTPRILIKAIVRVMQPDPLTYKEFTICDPACGTAGFLVASYEWLKRKYKGVLPREDVERIRKRTYFGTELVPRPRRLALMNLFLHGIEGSIKHKDAIYEPDEGMRFDVVLTNPPFGTKGADQAPDRDEFMVRTSNKQLNFIQHVVTILKPYGRAAIVVPDNCLFEEQANRVFEYLLNDCNLHTLLRLPQGTFSPYSPGVKANVLFFTKGRPTEEVWIYDARTNIPSITKKERPLKDEHFSEFEACFGDDPNCFSVGAIEYREKMAGKIERFKKFHISYIKERGYNLDIFWLKEEGRHEHISESPETLANDALLHIQTATNKLQAVLRFFSQIRRGTG